MKWIYFIFGTISVLCAAIAIGMIADKAFGADYGNDPSKWESWTTTKPPFTITDEQAYVTQRQYWALELRVKALEDMVREANGE
jgi:hypothetical protein